MARPRPSTARPLKFWPFLLIGVSAFTISKISVHPRINLTKDETGWTLRYDYAYKTNRVPADKGHEFPAATSNFSSFWRSPGSALSQLKQAFESYPDKGLGPPSPMGSSTATSDLDKLERNKLWILDTGATAHMCTNHTLLHSYRELPWGQTSRGFSSANGQLSNVVGIGSVTLDVQVPDDAAEPCQRGMWKTQPRRISRLTLSNVHFYPTKGVNILSWSQLKESGQAVGWQLRLVEEKDSSLTVMAVVGGILGGREREKVLMRFRLQGGLFVLDQPRKLLYEGIDQD